MTADNKTLKKYYVIHELSNLQYDVQETNSYVLFDKLFDELDDAVKYAVMQIWKHNIPPEEFINVRIYAADMTILLTGVNVSLKPIEEKDKETG